MSILQIPAYCTHFWTFYSKIQCVKGGDFLIACPNAKEIASNFLQMNFITCGVVRRRMDRDGEAYRHYSENQQSSDYTP
jgi:hypothetical protein